MIFFYKEGVFMTKQISNNYISKGFTRLLFEKSTMHIPGAWYLIYFSCITIMWIIWVHQFYQYNYKQQNFWIKFISSGILKDEYFKPSSPNNGLFSLGGVMDKYDLTVTYSASVHFGEGL